MRAKGLELEAQMRLGGGLQGVMSYALQRARGRGDRRKLVNSPGQMAKLRMSVPGPSRRSFVSVEVLSMSSRLGQFAGDRIESRRHRESDDRSRRHQVRARGHTAHESFDVEYRIPPPTSTGSAIGLTTAGAASASRELKSGRLARALG